MKIFQMLWDLIYPSRCIFCNKMTEFGSGEFICDECKEAVEFCDKLSCCKICGKPQISLGEKEICYSCLSKTYRMYKRAVAVVKYNKLTSAGIKRYKSGNGEIAGKVMGKMMAERVKTELEETKIDVIVGVAPSNKRAVKRGFEPVDVICKSLSEFTGIPYIKGALVKIKKTKKQSGLDYAHRVRNIIGSIGLSKTADVSGKTVLLADDVMTTGSTIDECAYVLKQGGAKAVYAVTFATTTKEPKTYVNK